MTRRTLFGWLASFFLPVPVPAQPVKPVPCLTPAYAGFEGWFFLQASSYKVRLASAFANNPARWGIQPGRMGVWKNHDNSVSKVVWRNLDGKLFSLEFVPMEEPTSNPPAGAVS